jgi:hypothetical protein
LVPFGDDFAFSKAEPTFEFIEAFMDILENYTASETGSLDNTGSDSNTPIADPINKLFPS